ncbi:hypothetical protein GCM10009785_20140 [Brooklawnia cerclae]|uniref:D-psicose/D-tagatose/L-ribulose 3-epimerase n=1 Tax=Brooklawnia cerclae TaxID=349934 RepID=A0ABX0SFV2_9ACTN|nr:sugar phosphate isomerase/epimerase family protein [Brooklawnia cerclae]NIH57244.1 D-psicose/D-tagatose/L-ribulose 3-epimerase [Brooklawnia cerclae]
MNSPEIACGVNVYCSGPDAPDLPAALDDMAGVGYSHIALSPFSKDDLDVAALKKALADSGVRPIPMSGQAPDANVSSPDEAVRAKGLDLLKSSIDLAHELGADQLNGVVYALFGDHQEPFSAERIAESARLVGQAADYAKGAGIRMTFEVVNRYETSMLNTAVQAIDYVRQSGSDNLFVHLDSYHMGIEEADIPAAVRSALPVLGYLELGQSGRGSLLTGSVDIRGAVQAAKDAGYTGRFGLEAFTRQLLPAGGANGLAIWRQTYTDPHALAAEAVDIVRSVYAGQ